MKTVGVFVILFLASVLTEVRSYKPCDHHHQCTKTQCCYKGIIELNIFGGPAGNCENYKKVGEKCEFVDLYSCGCQPGLKCLPKNSTKDEYDHEAERICKKSSDPYVEPSSEASCDKDSECPTKGECCAKDLDLGFPDIFGDGKKGHCKTQKKEGEMCATVQFLECGCAPGLVCQFPDTDPADGATPQRVCRKKSTN